MNKYITFGFRPILRKGSIHFTIVRNNEYFMKNFYTNHNLLFLVRRECCIWQQNKNQNGKLSQVFLIELYSLTEKSYFRILIRDSAFYMLM